MTHMQLTLLARNYLSRLRPFALLGTLHPDFGSSSKLLSLLFPPKVVLNYLALYFWRQIVTFGRENDPSWGNMAYQAEK